MRSFIRCGNDPEITMVSAGLFQNKGQKVHSQSIAIALYLMD